VANNELSTSMQVFLGLEQISCTCMSNNPLEANFFRQNEKNLHLDIYGKNSNKNIVLGIIILHSINQQTKGENKHIKIINFRYAEKINPKIFLFKSA